MNFVFMFDSDGDDSAIAAREKQRQAAQKTALEAAADAQGRLTERNSRSFSFADDDEVAEAAVRQDQEMEAVVADQEINKEISTELQLRPAEEAAAGVMDKKMDKGKGGDFSSKNGLAVGPPPHPPPPPPTTSTSAPGANAVEGATLPSGNVTGPGFLEIAHPGKKKKVGAAYGSAGKDDGARERRTGRDEPYYGEENRGSSGGVRKDYPGSSAFAREITGDDDQYNYRRMQQTRTPAGGMTVGFVEDEEEEESFGFDGGPAPGWSGLLIGGVAKAVGAAQGLFAEALGPAKATSLRSTSRHTAAPSSRLGAEEENSCGYNNNMTTAAGKTFNKVSSKEDDSAGEDEDSSAEDEDPDLLSKSWLPPQVRRARARSSQQLSGIRQRTAASHATEKEGAQQKSGNNHYPYGRPPRRRAFNNDSYDDENLVGFSAGGSKSTRIDTVLEEDEEEDSSSAVSESEEWEVSDDASLSDSDEDISDLAESFGMGGEDQDK